MKTDVISMRMSKESLKELKEFIAEEKLSLASEAARKLLMLGLEKWKQEKAIEKLTMGKVSFLKACKLAGLNAWEFADLLKERKVEWVKESAQSVREEIKEALR